MINRLATLTGCSKFLLFCWVIFILAGVITVPPRSLLATSTYLVQAGCALTYLCCVIAGFRRKHFSLLVAIFMAAMNPMILTFGIILIFESMVASP